MPLKQKDIEELKSIFEAELGYRPNDKDAWDAAIRLMSTFEVLLRPDKDQETNHPSGQPLSYGKSNNLREKIHRVGGSSDSLDRFADIRT